MPAVRDRQSKNVGRTYAPLRVRVRSRPGRCCCDGRALSGLWFLARNGPRAVKPGSSLAWLRSRPVHGTVVHNALIPHDLAGTVGPRFLSWRVLAQEFGEDGA